MLGIPQCRQAIPGLTVWATTIMNSTWAWFCVRKDSGLPGPETPAMLWSINKRLLPARALRKKGSTMLFIGAKEAIRLVPSSQCSLFFKNVTSPSLIVWVVIILRP